MMQRTYFPSIANRPSLLLRVQEHLQRARADDGFERASRLPLLRLAAAVLVALLALGTASGLIAAS
jgi:hypothetical protein